MCDTFWQNKSAQDEASLTDLSQCLSEKFGQCELLFHKSKGVFFLLENKTLKYMPKYIQHCEYYGVIAACQNHENTFSL